MKNYVNIQEIKEIYTISQRIVDEILKKHKIDIYKGKKWLMIHFKDFHKAYISFYNPWLFSELDNKKSVTPRKPEEVEQLLKFEDTDWLFTKTFSKSYKKINKQKPKGSKSLFIKGL